MRKKPSRKTAIKKYYQLNQRITASELRVIDAERKQVGVLTRDEALKKAAETDVDLVLIAPTAKPPVAKLIEFNKFLYQEEKKHKEAKKGVKKSGSKDIKLTLFVAQGDLDRLIDKGREFLDEGNQVRLNLTLRGRQIVKKQMGFDLIKKYIEALGDVNIAKEPRLEGRVIRTVVSKKK